MSAAMSPPQLGPQRARAFINHSPESYREAIGARAASRGSPRQGQPSPPRADTPLRTVSPLQQQQSNTAGMPPLGWSAANAGSSSSSSSSGSTAAPASGVSFGFGVPPSARAQRSDTMPALPAAPARPQSQPAQGYERSFSSGSESGSSQPSENEKRVKEFKDAPRKRRRTSPNELHILETEFARNNKPCKEERERIAATMGMDEKAVQVWFQNKRQSCRRQQSHSGSSSGAARTQSLPMIPTPVFQDENAAPVFAAPMPPPPFTSKPAFAVQGAPPPAKRAKSLRLAMSADGKAELVERSPLKSLHHNGPTQPQFAPLAPMPHLAMRFASMPLSGMETECATSLLFLKSGHWP